MAEWLVEEVHGTDLGGPEEIKHWVLEASSPQEAMWYAGGGGPKEFMVPEFNSEEAAEEFWEDYAKAYQFAFGPQELVEVIPGYMWSAADGSMIAYDVRKLREVK